MKKRIPKWIWLICVIFLVMQYIICLNVYIMGDDYMYGTFGHNGVFAPVFSYYLTGNGRWLVNILDSFCLSFDRSIYIIINPWLLLLLGVLLYDFISMTTGTKDYIVLVASFISISVISVLMTCEVFYWITGAMNYLVPALLLLASMSAVIKMRSGNILKRQAFAYSVICVLSCLTMEQYGLMAIGWMLLIWGWDLIKTRTCNKVRLVVFLISALGLATIIFAPANFVRFDDAVSKGTSVVTKIIDLIYYDYYSVVSATLLFMIAAYCAFKLYLDKKYIASIISGGNAVILLLVFDYKLFVVSNRMLMVLALISILMSISIIIPYIVSIYKSRGIIYIISLFVIGIGSQIMLLKTDLWGFRTSFSWILLYLILLLSVIADRTDTKSLSVLACIACIAINPYVGLLGVVGLISIFVKKKNAPVLAASISILAIIAGLSDEIQGYKENSQIHKQNTVAAEKAILYSEIEIQDYIDEQYGWTSPPLSEFHEKYFRSYYGISDEVSILYVESEQD